MKLGTAALITAMSLATAAVAQPTITSLGIGPVHVAEVGGGLNYVSGPNSRMMLNGSALSFTNIPGVSANGTGLMSMDGNIVVVGVPNVSPQIAGNTATGVTPAFSLTPTLVAGPIAATEGDASIWNATTGTLTRLGGLPIVPDLMVYGSGSSGGSTSNFITPNGISSNGRFVVGQGYISTYNSAAGTTISNNTFQWRPWIWDSQANGGLGAYTVLPTTFRTSSNTWRRRTGAAFAVSADGLVIAGAQEHNVAGSPAADPDACRPVVWRWNAGTSSYDMTYLPVGVNGSGFPYSVSISIGTMVMNSAGTIIVAPTVNNAGTGIIGKWVWDAGTSTWTGPTAVAGPIATPASWLPGLVTSCGVPAILSPSGMTEDGNTIVGSARYSTCGGFMSGGFIWNAGDGVTYDWYDYLVAEGTPGMQYYGPIGDNGDPTRGLPRLGFPRSISPTGNVVVGVQGGNQIIPGAAAHMVHFTGGPACVPAVVMRDPNNLMYSRCSIGNTISFISLGVNAGGTLPISFQWNKDGNPLSNGTTPTGSIITGATDFQVRVNVAGPADSGTYTVTATGPCGSPVTSAGAVVQNDPTVPVVGNDTCETATNVGEGSHNFNICGAYTASGTSQCTPLTGTDLGDVWYRYTATFTGEARFQTCGSGFDSVLTLLDGCNGAELACNNDVTSRGLVGTSCAATRSLISRYNVTTGQVILVRVSVMNTSSATGQLTISQAPAAPANDLCTNPTTVGIGTHAFNLAEATDDLTIGTNICSAQTQAASNRDVWFRLATPCGQGGTYTISTCGSTISNPMLHVMADCGTVLACNDNVIGTVAGCSSQQALISNLQVTGPVLIRVSSSGTNAPASGLGNLVITGTSLACCGSADFDNDGDAGTDFDIEAFFACLAGNCCPTCFYAGADFDVDGDSGTDADIEAFFRVLAGGNC